MAKLAALIDDFQDNSIDASKWATSGTVAETGGRARLTPTTSFSFWGTLSPRTWDLSSSQVTAHIPTITSNGSTGTLQSGMAVDADANNLVGMRKLGSELICSKKVAGVSTELSFTPYSAVNHLFWRIRADATNIYFETSATGSGTFFVQHTENIAALGFAITTVGFYFFSGYSGVEAFPGTFQIEAVNPGLPLTATSASTSSGSLAILKVSPLEITGAAASTSTGTLAWTILPAATLHISFSGASTSAGSFSPQILATGAITGSALSTSAGSLALSIYVLTLPENYYYFEPPIAYDLPPTLPEPTRPRWINAHAKWKGGQRRGRSILKYTGDLVYPSDTLFPDTANLFPLVVGQVTYVIVDTPTVDQMAAADFTYQGGHVYVVANDEAENLVNAGFTIGAPA